MSKKSKEKSNENRQQFLLSFFDKDGEYEEKEVNGFWLVKQIHGESGKPMVAIYKKEAFKNYREFSGRNLLPEVEEIENMFKNLT